MLLPWEQLANATPEDIRNKDWRPEGFKPLPHVKQAIDYMLVLVL